MNSLRSVVTVFLLVVCVVLLILYRGSIGSFFERVRLAVGGIFDTSFSYGTFLALKREKEASLIDLNIEQNEKSPDGMLRASVYSRYPFTGRDLIVVTRGINDGVKVGMPVLSLDGVLVGIVRNVYKSQSEVQTFFDSEWRSSVAIGKKNVKAVIQGGNTPQLELIPKDGIFSTTSVVVNISPELPFNLPIGTVESNTFLSDDAWQNAVLTPYVNIQEIREVFIETDFP